MDSIHAVLPGGAAQESGLRIGIERSGGTIGEPGFLMLEAQWSQELMYDASLIQPSLRDGGNTRLLFPALKRRAIVGCPSGTTTDLKPGDNSKGACDAQANAWMRTSTLTISWQHRRIQNFKLSGWILARQNRFLPVLFQALLDLGLLRRG